MRTEVLKHIAVWLAYSLHREARGQEPHLFGGCGIGVGWEWAHLSWEASKPIFIQLLLITRASLVVNLFDGLQ